MDTRTLGGGGVCGLGGGEGVEKGQQIDYVTYM